MAATALNSRDRVLEKVGHHPGGLLVRGRDGGRFGVRVRVSGRRSGIHKDTGTGRLRSGLVRPD